MVFGHGLKAEGSLRRNPFYLLGAAATDNLARIAARAEERSLAIGAQLCQKAHSDLANLHSRFSAEIAWLPGVSPDRAVAEAENMNCESPEARSELPPLARANALAACIESTQIPDNDIVPILLALASASEEIDPEAVMRDINQDRSIASISLADDIQQLYFEIAARRGYYRDVARQLLNSLPTRTLVRLITELAAKSTNGARIRAPTLVEELVDGYETDAQAFIDGESYNLKKLVALIRLRAAQGETKISGLIALLRETLANWSYVITPILLISRGKESDHAASRRLASRVRSLAVDLGSEYGFSHSANEIMECLLREFALLSDFRDRVSKAAPAIAEIRKGKDHLQARSHGEELDRSLFYSADVGLIFKRRLEFSAAGLSWKGRTCRLEEINGLRWGRTRHTVSGLPTLPTYVIGVQTPNLGAIITLRSVDTYSEIIDRLWRTVGVRILFEYVEQLKKGGRVAFPCALVEDVAVTLTTKMKFGANREMRLTWDKVSAWSTDENFVIGMKGDSNVCTAMSYTKTNNVRVLRHMIGLILASGKPAVSAILD